MKSATAILVALLSTLIATAYTSPTQVLPPAAQGTSSPGASVTKPSSANTSSAVAEAILGVLHPERPSGQTSSGTAPSPKQSSPPLITQTGTAPSPPNSPKPSPSGNGSAIAQALLGAFGSGQSSTNSAASSGSATPNVTFGVLLSTLSGRSYTLTYVSTTASTSTTVVATVNGTATSKKITPGGAIWVVPTPPPDIGPPGPPPGAIIPESSGGSNPLCLFGCGGANINFPCLIDCKGGSDDTGKTSGKTSDRSRTQTSSHTVTSSPKSTSTASSSCKKTTAPSCSETVVLSTSFFSGSKSSTVKSKTSTKCETITACDAKATTKTSTSSTKASEYEYDCKPTSCGNACSLPKRAARDVVPDLPAVVADTTSVLDPHAQPTSRVDLDTTLASELYAQPTSGADFGSNRVVDAGAIVSVRAQPAVGSRSSLLAKRAIPAPSHGQSVTDWIGGYFKAKTVRGSGQERDLVSWSDPEDIDATSRYDDFSSNDFSAGVTGLCGCISVVVASRKGVWTSHFWQASFEGAFKGSDDATKTFQRLVMDQLSKDSKDAAGPKFDSLKAREASAFSEDDRPKILVSTPALSSSNPDSSKWQAATDHITAAVSALLPAVGRNDVVVFHYPYSVPSSVKSGGAKEFKASGKMLTIYGHDTDGKGTHHYAVYAEDQLKFSDSWSGASDDCGPGNHKRGTDPNCSLSTSARPGSSSTKTRSGTPTGTKTSSPSMTTTSKPKSRLCLAHQDPDAGPGHSGCQCSGTSGLIPFMTNSKSVSPFDVCGYTGLPKATSAPAATSFTSTNMRNGFVYTCASSSFNNFAVNTIPACAGSSKVVSTVTSIYAASTSSAQASSSVAAKATPTARCPAWDDDDDLAYKFQISGINGWAGTDGASLRKEEKGCAALSKWSFTTCKDGSSQAWFDLSIAFKKGCVERAIHSAGGPEGIQCQHLDSSPDDSRILCPGEAPPRAPAAQPSQKPVAEPKLGGNHIIARRTLIPSATG